MPDSPDMLLARLDALGITHRTIRHAPVFSVQESKALRPELPGGHTKNLFLAPRSGPPILAVLEEDRRVSVNALARSLGSDRVRFASPEALIATLGVPPGSVTPFALVNARPGLVRPVFDRQLMTGFEWINIHPLTNTMTTAIRPVDLLRFLEGLGHVPELVDLPGPPPY